MSGPESSMMAPIHLRLRAMLWPSRLNETKSHLLAPKLLVGALVGIVSFLIAWPITFSTLAPYDDEGYVMMTLKTYGEGHRLYAETHTQYGPAFYQLLEVVHRWIGVPISHNAIRLKTVLVWSCCTLIAYAVLSRGRVPIWWGAAIASLVHLHLDKLALEPGHPQEIVVLLLMCMVGILSTSNPYRWGIAALFAAIIGMTKINCGFLAASSLIIASLVWDSNYLGSPQRQRLSNFLTVLMVGGAASLGVSTACLLQGVTLDELLWGLVYQHRRFTGEFFRAIPFSWIGAAISIAFMVAALPGFQMYRQRLKRVWPPIVLVVAITGLASTLLEPLQHGLQPRGAATWLVALGPSIAIWLFIGDLQQEFTRSFRVFLAALICISPIMAYPTPGTQLAIATVFHWLGLGILLADGWAEAAWKNFRSTQAVRGRSGLRYVTLSMAIPLFLLLFYWGRWIKNEPLGIPGANWIRLSSADVAREKGIANAIEATGCEYLLFDGHTHNRFYFWTGTKPLTSANPTFWPRMLTERETENLERTLREHRGNVCLVFPAERNRLAGGNAKGLRDLMERGFRSRGQIGDWEIGVYSEERMISSEEPTLSGVGE